MEPPRFSNENDRQLMGCPFLLSLIEGWHRSLSALHVDSLGPISCWCLWRTSQLRPNSPASPVGARPGTRSCMISTSAWVGIREVLPSWFSLLHWSWRLCSKSGSELLRVGGFKDLFFSIIYIYIYMGCHPSHWRTHIFQDGSCTTNQCFKNKIMTRESQEIDGRCRSSIRMLRLFKTCLAYKGGSAYMIHVAAIRIHIHTYAYTYEQPSKLALWKICIRWTLVVIKCKKLRLAMGPFQIAIPPFEMFHLRPTVLGSGLVAQSTVVAMCFKYNLFWAPSFGCLKN